MYSNVAHIGVQHAIVLSCVMSFSVNMCCAMLRCGVYNCIWWYDMINVNYIIVWYGVVYYSVVLYGVVLYCALVCGGYGVAW